MLSKRKLVLLRSNAIYRRHFIIRHFYYTNKPVCLCLFYLCKHVFKHLPLIDGLSISHPYWLNKPKWQSPSGCVKNREYPRPLQATLRPKYGTKASHVHNLYKLETHAHILLAYINLPQMFSYLRNCITVCQIGVSRLPMCHVKYTPTK
jgi:hypothetical protein